MKKFKFMLFAVAAIAAASCAKEIAPENTQTGNDLNVELIPMSFTAGSEATRAEINEQAIHWQAGDQINVFDASGTTYEPFTTTEGGASVTFEGMAGKSEGYYALYPYQSDAKMENGTIFAKLPSVQTAVENSFDPKAFISVARSDAEGNFTFKNVMALVKFTMPEGENASSVTLSANADGENLSGSAKITFNDNGIPSQTYVSGEMHKTVTLKGNLEAGKTYYFAVRSGISFKEGLTISIDGRKYRTSTAKPSENLSRHRVMTLPAFTFKEGKPKDFYTAYEHGFDLNIGGQKFDKATYGEATLITARTSGPSSGVIFINPGFEQPIGSNIQKMAIIGRYADQRSVLTRSGLAYISGTTDINNYLILANVEYKVTNLGNNKYYFGVNNTDVFENLVFDNIKVELPNAISLATCANNDNRAFKNVVLMNSDIKVGASSSEATYDGATTTYLIKSDAETKAEVNKDLESLTIKNNVIYSDGEVKRFRIFSSEKTGIGSLSIRNNTIVGCYTYYGYVAFLTGSNGIQSVANNLFHIPSHGAIDKWYSIVYPITDSKSVTDEYKAIADDKFSNNKSYYGDTAPTKGLRNMYGTGALTNALTAAPFTADQIAAGNFALPEGTSYGAKR